jgi:hypothetical protein
MRLRAARRLGFVTECYPPGDVDPAAGPSTTKWPNARRSDKVGVIEIRTLYIESDEEIVDRTHRALEHIKPEEVYLSTDCGLKAVPRFCADEKLRALSVCRGA